MHMQYKRSFQGAGTGTGAAVELLNTVFSRGRGSFYTSKMQTETLAEYIVLGERAR